MNRIVISGYYGFDNMGDETSLAGIIRVFKELDPTVKFTVLSRAPSVTSDRYGVKAVYRYDLPGIVKAISRADLFMSGGGSLLQDVTGYKSIPYYLGLIFLAQLMGKKTVFYAQGIGPVTCSLNRKLIRWIANRSDLVTVRDRSSLQRLQNWGVRSELLACYADPVFALTEETGTDQAPGETRRAIGISVREWKDNSYILPLTVVVDNLIQKTELEEVIVFPFYPEDDNLISREFAGKLKSPVQIAGEKPPLDYISNFSGLQFFIGVRLHSLIFAALNYIPFLGLSYDPKVTDFVSSILPGYSLSLPGLAQEDLEQKVTSGWENRKVLEDKLRDEVPMFAERAEENARVVLHLIRK